MLKEILYYPCITDQKTGKIDRVVGRKMSMEEAERFLKIHYRMAWLMCGAIPQPANMIDKRKGKVDNGI